MLLRALPKEAVEENLEMFPSDVGSLEDDKISLSESLTDNQTSVEDAPKIPLGGIRDRLLKVGYMTS